MAKISQEIIPVKKRNYSQAYRVHVYEFSGKVDLQTWDHSSGAAKNGYVNLKMSEEECEELITRLTFALHQAREVRDGG